MDTRCQDISACCCCSIKSVVYVIYLLEPIRRSIVFIRKKPMNARSWMYVTCVQKNHHYDATIPVGMLCKWATYVSYLPSTPPNIDT